MCPDTGAYMRQVSALETKRAADYEQDQKDIAALQARKVAERRSRTVSLSACASYALKYPVTVKSGSRRVVLPL
jgi:hypothetical protein